MKKIFILLFCLSFGLNYDVKAMESTKITYNKLDGIVYNQKIDGKLKSNTVTMFGMKDRIAYCIEPGVEINEKYYDIYTDWSMVDFSDDVKKLIEKIGYYGYEYPGHQTNYYYIAAQELIWKAVRPDIEVTWTTGKNLTGKVIDISKEKKEILDLVSNSDLLPSFSEESIKDEVGKTIILEDKNNVLEEYNISNSRYHNVVKEGNKLSITLNKQVVPSETLKLTRKYYDDAPLLIYSKGDSQKLAALRISTNKESYISLANEELPEIVEVPNTGFYNVSSVVGTVLVGLGIVFVKIH